MAWTTDNIYNFLLFLIDKNQESEVSPNDFFYAWNSESSTMQQDLLGRWQARANGKTGANIGMIKDEAITLQLQPFTISVPLVFASGFAPLPNDFVYHLALTIANKKVYHFNKDQRYAIMDSVIDPPSQSDGSYYYTEYNLSAAGGGTYELLPGISVTAKLDYIQAVRDIKWAFTPSVSGQDVYDSVNSVQPQWGQNQIIEITKRVLKQMGVTFKEQDFAAYGESIITKGD